MDAPQAVVVCQRKRPSVGAESDTTQYPAIPMTCFDDSLIGGGVGEPITDAEIEAADARIAVIKQEIRDYLWDWDLPSGIAFAPEWEDTALHFIAQYVELKIRRREEDGSAPAEATGKALRTSPPQEDGGSDALTVTAKPDVVSEAGRSASCTDKHSCGKVVGFHGMWMSACEYDEHIRLLAGGRPSKYQWQQPNNSVVLPPRRSS